MTMDYPRGDYSTSRELVRSGLKFALGARGDVIVEFMDRRRAARLEQRIRVLSEGIDEGGIAEEDLAARIEGDDQAQELLEATAQVAMASRLDEKVRYLGRCLAAALNRDDDAAIDEGWVRLNALRDVEALHVRLLAAVDRAVKLSFPGGAPAEALVTDVRTSGQGELLRRTVSRYGAVPEAVFAPTMATLVRSGLVAADAHFDLDISVDTNGADTVEDLEVEATPDLVGETLYRLTPLGSKVFEELRSAANKPPDRDDGPAQERLAEMD